MQKQPKKKRSKLKAYNNWGYFFVTPFVIAFLIFSVYPVLRTLYLSFTDIKIMKLNGEVNFVGFENYKRVFTDKFFWRSLKNTLIMWGANIVTQLGLAFILMMIFSDIKYKMRGLSVYRLVYYLPNLIAATSIALLFLNLLDTRYGSVNVALKQICDTFGWKFKLIDWLGTKWPSRMSISGIQTWMWFGNSFLMLMAGVQGVSKDYLEAASIDGAGRWTIFGKITLPLIKPIMMYVAITSFIGGLQLFDIPYLMVAETSQSYQYTQTTMMYLYRFAFNARTTQTAYASAIAYALFIIILIVSVIQYRMFNRKGD
ncbi:MAG: sugar ABC transporter permease [Lachnospiraceae bacterium]|nr:sugar ABC transporter permease [Lachnospiraceae bacterium]